MWTHIRRDHPQAIKFKLHECPNVPLAVVVNACGEQFSFDQPPDYKIFIIICYVYYRCTSHHLFICKSQHFTNMHLIFPCRNKWYLKTWRINHIFSSICVKWVRMRSIATGRICIMLDVNIIICITFIMVLRIFLFKIENDLMVIHIILKITLLNPLFILIHIINIFTIISSMIFVFVFVFLL